MKFDYIVSNPPYQDGNKKGGQNKLYYYFSKKAINDWSKNDSEISFVTPTSILKINRFFSLTDILGLKHINYTAGNYFNVGVNICNWHVDKQYSGKVEVVDSNENTTFEENDEYVADYNIVDKNFIKLQAKIRVMTKNLNNRMFKRNNQNSTWGTDRNKIKTDVYKYPIHKLIKDSDTSLVQYIKKEPHFYGQYKFVIRTSGSFKIENCSYTKFNFNVNHVFCKSNKNEFENIKSFLFSEYFRNIVNNWKKFEGYGFNNALIYLPKFDKTKHWTNKEVKQFFENIEKS